MSIAIHADLLVNQAERIDQKAPVNPLPLDLDHQFTMRRSQSIGSTVNLVIPLTHRCQRRKKHRRDRSKSSDSSVSPVHDK